MAVIFNWLGGNDRGQNTGGIACRFPSAGHGNRAAQCRLKPPETRRSFNLCYRQVDYS